MTQEQPNNPLHGITLEMVVTKLEAHYGWEELGRRIRINCFRSDPSVKSSLKFLRKTQWARDKVEQLYIDPFTSTPVDKNSPWHKPATYSKKPNTPSAERPKESPEKKSKKSSSENAPQSNSPWKKAP